VSHAKGCRFWDENNVEYIDYSMGLLSVSIGHANEYVNSRVTDVISKGTSFARPSLLEGELAEKINSLIPSAEMIKFAKNGSDVTSAAIRLARYYTGKKYIARCSQQPFLSFNDWFIASTSKPGGIPDEMHDWVLRFEYNNISSVEKIFSQYPNQIACIIMEPFTNEFPQPGFLKDVKEICEKNNALLVFDEMITGFRSDIRGAQFLYGVTPHLSTFGKGIANGFPLSVLCGQKQIMEHGGINGNVFLLSCTFGGETTGLAAGIATIDFMEQNNVVQKIADYGELLMKLMNASIANNGLAENIKITGHASRPELRFYENGIISFALKTFFMQETMKRGIFMERIGISFSHDEGVMNKTIEVIDEVLPLISSALNSGSLIEKIDGKIIEPVFTH
jgi:glutamate-1-semialdehyde 2,1-aminomutase